jgi:ribosomal-protein-alanine N-acetyltransferase
LLCPNVEALFSQTRTYPRELTKLVNSKLAILNLRKLKSVAKNFFHRTNYVVLRNRGSRCDDVSLSSFVVREATKNDLPLICEIEDGSFPDPYPPSLMERLQRDHSEGFLVAESDSGMLVGYCVASENGSLAHLISIGVLDEYRGRGVGTILLKTLLARLNERAINELWLEVNVGNEAAIRFYERFGFVRAMIIDSYYADRSNALRMRLTIGMYAEGRASARGQ